VITTVKVPYQAWLGLMGSRLQAIREQKPLHVAFLCPSCHESHMGVFLCAHPERLEIQVELIEHA